MKPTPFQKQALDAPESHSLVLTGDRGHGKTIACYMLALRELHRGHFVTFEYHGTWPSNEFTRWAAQLGYANTYNRTTREIKFSGVTGLARLGAIGGPYGTAGTRIPVLCILEAGPLSATASQKCDSSTRLVIDGNLPAGDTPNILRQWIYIDAKPLIIGSTPSAVLRCACGVDITGGLHSDWCPKHDGN